VTTFNLADLFESVADAVPDREAVVVGDRRLTYRTLDERANRMAHYLAARGVVHGDHIGLQLLNGTEYLEGMLGAFKLGAVPVNVNYRYVEDELRGLYTETDIVAAVVHREFASRLEAVAGGMTSLRTVLVVDGDANAESRSAIEYEEALSAASPARDFRPRSSDDLYLALTGGTTGAPKGVVWRHEDIFFAAMGGGDPMQTGDPIRRPDELRGRLLDPPLVALPCTPFVHVSGHWLAFTTFFGGGTVVIPPPGRFEPETIWRLVGDERVNILTIAGDVMARPLADVLASRRSSLDTSSLVVIGSGGVALSPVVRRHLVELLPDIIIVDGLGATETGAMGSNTTIGAAIESRPRFGIDERTVVLDDDLRRVAPGSGRVGRIARRGHIPIGYYNDRRKTEATFVEVDGDRWVLPGDTATVEADGTLTLIGRAGTSINTGGEKVFAEEVERVLTEHPGVADAVVVGLPDERFGERVVAVVSAVPGHPPSLDDVQTFCRSRLAGYKLPRELHVVGDVERLPGGKPDYRWARTIARRARSGSPAT
jgi:acyl-CoA synthetase (AMP-forming)/AMP-acid ligase II